AKASSTSSPISVSMIIFCGAASVFLAGTDCANEQEPVVAMQQNPSATRSANQQRPRVSSRLPVVRTSEGFPKAGAFVANCVGPQYMETSTFQCHRTLA